MVIRQESLADVPVQNQVLPKGGPKAVPVSLDFGAANGQAEWILDAQNMQALGRFSNLQTIWVDNSLNTQLLTITMGGSGQVLKVQPGKQGYYPVLSANPIYVVFSVPATNGTDATVIMLLNFPCPFAEWTGV